MFPSVERLTYTIEERHSQLKVYRLKLTRPFLNVFYFKQAQRVPAEKPSKYRPNELMAMHEDHDPVILYLPLLVIDCNWCRAR